MMRVATICFALFLFHGVLSQSGVFPRPYTIGDVEANDLFKPPLDPTNTKSPFRGPLDPPFQKPQSYRTIYIPWWRHPALTALTGEPTFPEAPANGLAHKISLRLVDVPIDSSYTFKYAAPLLEVDPWNCATQSIAALGNCRCNVAAANDPYASQGDYVFAGTLVGRLVTFSVPNWNYFEHAPYPGQNPFIRTYRKLCMKEPQTADQPVYASWIDTTVWVAVTRPCNSGFSGAFNCVPTDADAVWLSRHHQGGTLPDPVNADGTWNIFPPNWICNNVNFLGAFFDMSNVATATAVSIANNVYMEPEYCWGETLEMFYARRARTQCCGAREAGGYEVDATSSFFGTCFNPNVESCCGWKPFNKYEEQCCSRRSARINYLEQPCKCQYGGHIPDSNQVTEEDFDCRRSGATVINGADFRDNGPIVTTRKCCVNTKYEGVGKIWDTSLAVRQYGVCYDTTDPNVKCCDDGSIYDPGTSQCCKVNGVQSLNKPCPCDIKSDCPGHNDLCCLQRFPRAYGSGESLSAYQNYQYSQCNIYANYPEGNGPAEVQRCYGSCYSSEFQICCNGQVCSKEYDRCCNSTCCNRFTSTCMEGSRPGSWGAGGRYNSKDYLVSFEICSEKECFTTRRAFWVFAMPVFWLFASLVALSIVTIVARRATHIVFEMTEQAMVFFAVCLTFIAMPHFFCPSYKYGVVAVIVGLICILAAVLRSKRLSVVGVVAVVVAFIYWVDPFEGNIYLSLATKIPNHLPTPNSEPVTIPGTIPESPAISGLLEYILILERFPRECTSFYDYFEHDKYAYDFERRYNPTKMTYAYCSKAWLTALLIFTILGILFILVLIVLSIFSLAKKLIPKAPKDDLAFEVRPEYE